MRESAAPIEHLKLYDKYDFLITRKAERDVDAFLAENHHYERIIQEIRKYQQLIEDIQYTTRKVGGPFVRLFSGPEGIPPGSPECVFRPHRGRLRPGPAKGKIPTEPFHVPSIVGNPGCTELDRTDTVLVLIELKVYYSPNFLSTFI